MKRPAGYGACRRPYPAWVFGSNGRAGTPGRLWRGGCAESVPQTEGVRALGILFQLVSGRSIPAGIECGVIQPPAAAQNAASRGRSPQSPGHDDCESAQRAGNATSLIHRRFSVSQSTRSTSRCATMKRRAGAFPPCRSGGLAHDHLPPTMYRRWSSCHPAVHLVTLLDGQPCQSGDVIEDEPRHLRVEGTAVAGIPPNPL